MYWNVHLDGLERTHDIIVEREGVFKECVLAIKMAKLLGYQVATNTTVYKETDMVELEQLFDFLSDLGVDGHTITPGYEYDAAKQDMIKRPESAAGELLPHAQDDGREVREDGRVDGALHVLRDAGLFRVPCRQARPNLLSVGHPDAQHGRLEGAVLFHDG
jgi:MoaA/NifB/PqqE/SkfB family radical SAM enzyme